jgi:hypothetical protein
MRQYLYLFWALVLAGIMLLTAAYPQCPQYATNRYDHVYDINGNLTFVSGTETASGMQYKF